MKNAISALMAILVSVALTNCEKKTISGEYESSPAPSQDSVGASTDSANTEKTDELRRTKALQPEMKKLATLIRAYADALSTTVSNTNEMLTSIEAHRNETKNNPQYALHPTDYDNLLIEFCDKMYVLFQKQVRNMLEVMEDEQVPQNVASLKRAITGHEDVPLKTVLLNAIEKCGKAQRTLRALHSRERTDLTDKLNQMVSAVRDLTEQNTELQTQAELLTATDSALDKQ